MEDANEDEEKGRVDEKAGRWVGEHGLSQVARAMTLSPSWPGLECSVHIYSLLQRLETQYISIREPTE
jgi:hypothetical protein